MELQNIGWKDDEVIIMHPCNEWSTGFCWYNYEYLIDKIEIIKIKWIVFLWLIFIISYIFLFNVHNNNTEWIDVNFTSIQLIWIDVNFTSIQLIFNHTKSIFNEVFLMYEPYIFNVRTHFNVWTIYFNVRTYILMYEHILMYEDY